MPTVDDVHAAISSLTTMSPWAIVLAATAGLLLMATPSVLAMLPVIVGYVAAEPGLSRMRAITRSVAFLTGTATTFGIYGLVFGWAGTVLAPLFGPNGYLVAGIVLMVLGSLVLARVKLSLPALRLPERKVETLWGAYLLGIPFGLAGSACPCSVPVVLAMLLYATSVGSAWFGGLLLFTFAFMRGLPLVLAGAFTGFLKDLRPLTRWRPTLEKLSGILLILLGVAFLLHPLR